MHRELNKDMFAALYTECFLYFHLLPGWHRGVSPNTPDDYPSHTAGLPTSVLEEEVTADTEAPTFIARKHPIETLHVSPYENFILSEAVIEAEEEAKGKKQAELDSVGAVSVVGPEDRQPEKKRKRISRKIDRITNQETLSQEQLSQETNKVIEDLGTPTYKPYKKIWQDLAQKNRDWGYNDASICTFLVCLREAGYSVSSRRCAVAAINELLEFAGICNSFIKHPDFPKANLLWKQIKKEDKKRPIEPNRAQQQAKENSRMTKLPR